MPRRLCLNRCPAITDINASALLACSRALTFSPRTSFNGPSLYENANCRALARLMGRIANCAGAGRHRQTFNFCLRRFDGEEFRQGKNGEPVAGWGTTIASLFDAEKVTVKNVGHAGRSSLKLITMAIGPRSCRKSKRAIFVLLVFGINDGTTPPGFRGRNGDAQ